MAHLFRHSKIVEKLQMAVYSFIIKDTACIHGVDY